MKSKKVSLRQLERYPVYLNFLLSLRNSGIDKVSSRQIADMMSCSEEQVRKDLQLISPKKALPGRQREVGDLIEYLKNFLGYKKINEAILIGVGHLGSALMSFRGFGDFGLEIVAGFDIDPALVNSTLAEKPIYDLGELSRIIFEKNIKIAILTTPKSVSQDIVDKLVSLGIVAIWNFVPMHLDAPKEIVIENFDFAASLAILAHRINQKT
ncbi:MAG: redox-sensing transcriptional repressor Rex [Erysipelotrichia bacterium]|nr:redox-sensing transcriptional repressor Rex [Erysipelotrichia bacterium]